MTAKYNLNTQYIEFSRSLDYEQHFNAAPDDWMSLSFDLVEASCI